MLGVYGTLQRPSTVIYSLGASRVALLAASGPTAFPAAQPAIAVDATARRQDRADFEHHISENDISIYRSGAAEWQTVGSFGCDGCSCTVVEPRGTPQDESCGYRYEAR
jgi:hypothetical protein